MSERSFKTEFPDFPEADMPPIPEGWEDHSWHNDAGPSFYAGDVVVFVDWKDPEMSDWAECRKAGRAKRFNASRLIREDGEVTDYGDDIISTDDWSELLAVVAAA